MTNFIGCSERNCVADGEALLFLSSIDVGLVRQASSWHFANERKAFLIRRMYTKLVL
jgi:hypothetical protein